MESLLFPFADYWSFYLGFTGFVILMLLLDLGVFHKNAHAVSVKEAAVWTGIWMSFALIFCAGLYFYSLHSFADHHKVAVLGMSSEVLARQVGLEFITGFIIEKALAIDNIFVFVVVFSYFAIPQKYQHRVLFYGIIGALLFRAGFIALGSVLLSYQWIVLLAGAFLILTGVKILFAKNEAADPGKNVIIRMTKKLFPVSEKQHGEKFFVNLDGKWVVTPLFLALVLIEFSDIIFAIDSVPAIFAITKEPFIVFTSNIFAILGLRSLYFLLAGVVDKFQYLKYALGLILIFVGLKMSWLNDLFGGKFPISWSLGIIGGLLLGAVVASLIKEKLSRP